ncbi:transposase [Catenulispora sp. NL8]|uniref:Transposase n=1 Tax=Catenulispora pinistramenti TaxID=2705254 RepID=A0ABS5KH02_9ACTN|nr:transposase [Catenulispora pinistramenti]MBS2545504.1 transposase [Catenulispora pinistramenti]
MTELLHSYKSFARTGYQDLIGVAHTQLGGPIMLVWDNLNTHLTAGMKQYIAARDWLTIYQLPACAPQLNPIEGIWPLIRRNLANTAFADPEHPIATIRQELRAIQYRSWLIDIAQAGTGLTLTTSPFEPQ